MQSAESGDAVLVEGHKDTPLPKLSFEDSERRAIPRDVSGVLGVLREVSTPKPPTELRRCWLSVNTPAELTALSRTG